MGEVFCDQTGKRVLRGEAIEGATEKGGIEAKSLTQIKAAK
jgi:hypothetical protein